MKRFLFGVVYSAALAFLVTGVACSQTSIVISNLNDDYSGGTTFGGSTSKAMGFTMGGTSYELTEVRAQINFASADTMPVVTLHSNNGSNNPGTLLLEFVPIVVSTTGESEVVFKPKAEPFGTFRLQADTTYWLVFRSLVQTGFTWQSTGANIIPGGIATHFGARLGATFPPTGASGVNNAYQIRASVRSNNGLFFQEPSTGRIGVATVMNMQFIHWRTFPQVVGSQWEVLTFGSFGGTSYSDALLRHKTTGQLAFWQSNGSNFSTFVAIPQIPPSVWQFKGAARLNSALDHLFYQNPQSGVVVVGVHDGTQITQWRIFPKVPNAAWEIVAVAGFNNDEIADVMFRNKTTGQIAVWQTNGFDFTTWNVFPQIPSSQWEFVGTMDSIFTSFRRVVFRHKSTGELATWETNTDATGFGMWRPFVAKQPAGYVFKGFGHVD